MAKLEDQVLLEKARQFDPGALEAVYGLYSDGLYAYACRLLGDPSLAEDCVSETFSRFLKALRRGQGPREFLKAYLYRVAHNWITDRFRHSPPEELPLEDSSVGIPDSAGDLVDAGLRAKELRAALRRLTPEQRQAVSLRYLEGFENEEVARAMDRPVGAAKALQQRGIAALRRMLLREDSSP